MSRIGENAFLTDLELRMGAEDCLYPQTGTMKTDSGSHEWRLGAKSSSGIGHSGGPILSLLVLSFGIRLLPQAARSQSELPIGNPEITPYDGLYLKQGDRGWPSSEPAIGEQTSSYAKRPRRSVLVPRHCFSSPPRNGGALQETNGVRNLALTTSPTRFR